MVVSRRFSRISNSLKYRVDTDLSRPCFSRRDAALWYVKMASIKGYFEVTHAESGMAKAVADVDGENQGGFGSDFSNVTGFSHMHDSG